ncbi:MAG: DNA glycosylase [Thermoproteota archaeon]
MLKQTFPINVDDTINSGQVFLWEKHDKTWYGINGNDVLAVSSDAEIFSYSKKSYDFFRNDDDFERILRDISRDHIVRSAVKRFPGLRLLRQDPFQCYISFIVSANSSIQNIKNTLQKICKKFGPKVEFNKNYFYLFPDPKKIAVAEKHELQSCGLGYRINAVKKAAEAVASGEIDFDFLKKSDYHVAKESLLKVFGIGNKVADCILLFSLEKSDSFPLDRWMLRVLQKYYSDKFELNMKTLTEKRYENLHNEIVKYFGPYAGYSQQFLFKMERELNQKKWL